MSQDDPHTAVNRCIGNDLTHRNACTPVVPVVPRQMDAPGAVVQMSDPKVFASRIRFGKAVGEEAAGSFEAVEQQRGFGTLMEHGNGVGAEHKASDSNRIHTGGAINPEWMFFAPLLPVAVQLG